MHYNQLARGIQSKRMQDLEAELPVADVEGEISHEPGGLGGPSPPNIIFFFWIRRSPQLRAEHP